MQSPKLTAGTGVLQASAAGLQDDMDLDAVDEILSQHSNARSHTGHASQADSPLVPVSGYSQPDKAQNNDHHAFAPAGPYKAAASLLIDLSDTSEQHRHASIISQAQVATAAESSPHLLSSSKETAATTIPREGETSNR